MLYFNSYSKMKINNIKQLQEEKKRISKHRHELESRISAEWKNMHRHTGTADKKENDGKTTLLKTLFTFAIRSIAKKAADKAAAKITGLF